MNPSQQLSWMQKILLRMYAKLMPQNIAANEAMARRICSMQGLTPQQQEDVIATLYCESRMTTNCITDNTNGSTDYGIAQLNSVYYIGPNNSIKTPFEALTNPEKCVMIIATAAKNGTLNDWLCYRAGTYKQFYPNRKI